MSDVWTLLVSLYVTGGPPALISHSCLAVKEIALGIKEMEPHSNLTTKRLHIDHMESGYFQAVLLCHTSILQVSELHGLKQYVT